MTVDTWAILGVLVAGFVAIWKGFSERSDRMATRLGERGAPSRAVLRVRLRSAIHSRNGGIR